MVTKQAEAEAKPAAQAQEQDLTLAQMFRKTVERCRDKDALRAKRDGQYQGITYGELQQQVHEFAAVLIEHGIKPGDRVAILSENRPEWVVADLGTLHVGACDVPIYATLTPHQIAYILNDSGARLLAVSNAGHLDKIKEVEGELSQLEGVIVFDDPKEVKLKKPVLRMAEVQERGRGLLDKNQGELDKRVAKTKGDDLASIVYTSGTTGEPKGAMLTHRNFYSNTSTCVDIIGYNSTDLELSFLPLCHVFERIMYYAGLYAGATIAYAESIDTVPANLGEVRPTFMPSVPRLFEKIHGRVLEGVEQGGFFKRQVFAWAMRVGRRRREAYKLYGGLPPLLELQSEWAHKLVFAKLHERVGGRIRYFLSGGAPLRRDVAEFFADAGLIILEGYGLTETSPVITLNTPEDYRFGTVGKVIAGVEVKIAEDGEILARGPNIMKGYWNKPQATAEAIDPDGWFHTGDIGVVDEDGFLTITDRKKELLVMSNGKKVPPQPIENALKRSPYIEQAMVIGDNRNFISALLVPAFGQLEHWATQRRVSGHDVEELLARPEVRALFQGEVDQVNEELARYEQVKEFVLAPRELSQDHGELTPTLKYKRRVILDHFKAQIEGMYGDK